jgi:hypothetical protein
VTTPGERFLTRVRRRLASLQPAAVSAYLRGLRTLGAILGARDVERAVSAAYSTARVQGAHVLDDALSDAFRPILTDEAVDAAFSRFRAVTQEVTRDGVAYFAKDVPGVGSAAVQSPRFGVLQPRVLDAIRTADDRVMQRLRPETRDSVRAILAQAYEAGDGPRTAAARLRGLIGLSPSELAQVENFRDALKGAAGRDWKGYTARDKRFDRTIERALAGGGLDDARIDKYVDAYARRRLALSAEGHARTTLLNANKLAQHASWQTAVDGGIVDGSLLVKERLTAGDSKVRPEHAEMRGETVPYDQPYSDGSVIPGEFGWNCRCWSRYYMRRA